MAAQNTDLLDLVLAFFIGTASHKKREITTTYREVLDKNGKIIVLRTVVDKRVK